MIALLAPILAFLLFLGLVRTLARGQSGWALWAKATAFRLGVLWFASAQSRFELLGARRQRGIRDHCDWPLRKRIGGVSSSSTGRA